MQDLASTSVPWSRSLGPAFRFFLVDAGAKERIVHFERVVEVERCIEEKLRCWALPTMGLWGKWTSHGFHRGYLDGNFHPLHDVLEFRSWGAKKWWFSGGNDPKVQDHGLQRRSQSHVEQGAPWVWRKTVQAKRNGLSISLFWCWDVRHLEHGALMISAIHHASWFVFTCEGVGIRSGPSLLCRCFWTCWWSQHVFCSILAM